MTDHSTPPLVRGQFDRDAATRLSDRSLDEAWAEPATRLLRLREGELPVRAHDHAGGGEVLDLVAVRGARDARHWFLGRADGAAVFATTMRDDDGYAEPTGGWRHPFRCAGLLNPLQGEIMGVALALANWHGSMIFSPRDGGDTAAVQGGWARLDASGGEHFPRTDPAVIVLVEHEDRLLLGSNVLWESGRFSLLAGFVEAGESAEQTVVREVFEEAGVEVENVRYVASQPWPFPRSLMLGFRASLVAGADPSNLAPDASEISELRWFTRDELRAPAAGLTLPGGLSIARWLIDLWVSEGDREQGDQGQGVEGQRDDGRVSRER